MKVIVSAINFGLGPSGKLSSIIERSISNRYDWYACGDKLDMSMFENNPFKDVCWSREYAEIIGFVKKYQLKVAIVVLDPQMAITLTQIGVKVIYIDSLPFMWSELDVIPTNVACYCAQKYPGYKKNQVLSTIENFTWINPITTNIYRERDSRKGDYVVMNFGGLHSPYGDGREYFEIMMSAFLPLIKNKIYLTGGHQVVNLAKSMFPEIECRTYPHRQFLRLVYNANLFITSPGLTTLYETCSMNRETIIMPPQNLSQIYNIIWAKSILQNIKTLNWNIRGLDIPADTGKIMSEEDRVKQIYILIKGLAKNEEYMTFFRRYVADTYYDKFPVLPQKNRKESDGAKEVLQILNELE